jgi:hypothetical protein
MKLSAKKLQLFPLKGRGKAAEEISRKLTQAAKDMKLPPRYDAREVVKQITEAYLKVRVTLSKWSKYGATDSEPRNVVLLELVKKVGKRYKLNEFEQNEIYYSV